jgi:hypothetical protein
LKWPTKRSTQSTQHPQKEEAAAGRAPTRSVGATVILVNGGLAAYLARGDRQLLTFLPEAEPERSKVGRAVAAVLIDRARAGGDSPRGMLIEEIDGGPAATHAMAPFLGEAGFAAGALGLQATYRPHNRQSSINPQSAIRTPQSQTSSSISSPFARRVFDDSDA